MNMFDNKASDLALFVLGHGYSTISIDHVTQALWDAWGMGKAAAEVTPAAVVIQTEDDGTSGAPAAPEAAVVTEATKDAPKKGKGYKALN